MTDEPPKKKLLAGLGQMLEKAASEQETAARKAKAGAATARDAASDPVSGVTAENRGYEITFRKKSSS